MAESAVSVDAVLLALDQVKDIAISYSLAMRTTYIASDPLAVAVSVRSRPHQSTDRLH